jgi:glycosyltransferase involved in cell wall biosynthesis
MRARFEETINDDRAEYGPSSVAYVDRALGICNLMSVLFHGLPMDQANPRMNAPVRREFDGVICIGGSDWWYHNRGHFDFQVMRRFARTMPVLFVNSLGVRVPDATNPGQFVGKIQRKLKSLARGVVNVENDFWVFSPLSIPGQTGKKISGFALAPQIRLAARRAGITRPLLWMHCPAGADLIDELKPVGMVMQRTDRFEAFPEGDPVLLTEQVTKIKRAAEMIIYCAPHLMAEEAAEVRSQLLVTHGADVQNFIAEGSKRAPGPADVAVIGKPRVGFIGGIDAHTFDPDLFLAVAKQMPTVNFVMIGSCSLPEGWCDLPNVRFLGRKPYDIISRYMAAMDVLIMPWNKSDWIKACNPIKLKEYLAVGRPVVTTDFPALDGWRDLVRVANDADTFASAIRASLTHPYDPAAARARVAGETWDAKAEIILRAVNGLGLVYMPSQASVSWSTALRAVLTPNSLS